MLLYGVKKSSLKGEREGEREKDYLLFGTWTSGAGRQSMSPLWIKEMESLESFPWSLNCEMTVYRYMYKWLNTVKKICIKIAMYSILAWKISFWFSPFNEASTAKRTFRGFLDHHPLDFHCGWIAPSSWLQQGDSGNKTPPSPFVACHSKREVHFHFLRTYSRHHLLRGTLWDPKFRANYFFTNIKLYLAQEATFQRQRWSLRKASHPLFVLQWIWLGFACKIHYHGA